MPEKKDTVGLTTAAVEFTDDPHNNEHLLGSKGETFACFGPKILANGYSVIPTATSDKRPIIAGWPQFCQKLPLQATVLDWAREHPTAGIGLACGATIVGIDIDILDGALADLVEGLVRQHLGDTPLVRVGMAPKRMLIYRPAEPIRPAKLHPIEIQSTGGQIIGFGIHPRTLKPYVWPKQSPLDTPVSALPKVTQAAVDRFLAACKSIVPMLSGGTQEPEYDEFGYVIGRREVHAVKCAWEAACRRTSDDHEAVLEEAWSVFIDGLHPDHRQRIRAKTGRPWAKNDTEFVSKVRSAVRKTESQSHKVAQKRPHRAPIEGVLPHFMADELRAEQAGERVRALVAEWMASGGNLAVAGAAGIGKSTTVLRAIKQRNDELGSFAGLTWYLTPTVGLAEELASKYKALGGSCIAIRGRLHEDSHRGPLCKRPCFVRAAIASGVSNIAGACCEREDDSGEYLSCPHRNECPYYEQLETCADVMFMSHEYMLQSLGEKFGKPDLIVIDEAFLHKIVRLSAPVTAGDLLREARDYSGIMTTIVEALRADASPKAALLGAGLTSKELVAAARALEPDLEVTLAPNMNDAQAKAALERMPPRNRAALTFRKIAEELHRDRDATYSIMRLKKHASMQVDNQEASGEVELFYIQYRREIKFKTSTPVLLLDATANELLLRSLWPDLRFEKISAERNAHVVQTHGFQAGKKAMTTGHRATKHVSDLRAFLERIGGEQPGLLITYKDVLWDKDQPRFPLPAGWSAAHFGDLRGRDEFKNCDLVVVCGRMQPRVEDVERMARGFFYDSDVPITFLTDSNFPQVERGFRMATGERLGTLAQAHPDPMVQAFVEQLREAEVVQAVDRLRLLHRQQQATVYLLTDLPVDVTVDRLEPWRSQVSQRSRIELAASRLRGVLPLVPAWLTRERTDLWSTKKKASMEIERLLKDRQAKPQMRFRRTDMEEDGFIASFGLKAHMYHFKTAAHPQGRPSRCLSVHPPNVTRMTLHALFGELVSFEAPPPVLATSREMAPAVAGQPLASKDDRFVEGRQDATG